MAMNGNVTMLIWLGKQHLGQRDKQEMDVNSKNETKITHDVLFDLVNEVESKNGTQEVRPEGSAMETKKPLLDS